jgi:hypothetical protein
MNQFFFDRTKYEIVLRFEGKVNASFGYPITPDPFASAGLESVIGVTMLNTEICYSKRGQLIGTQTLRESSTKRPTLPEVSSLKTPRLVNTFFRNSPTLRSSKLIPFPIRYVSFVSSHYDRLVCESTKFKYNH